VCFSECLVLGETGQPYTQTRPVQKEKADKERRANQQGKPPVSCWVIQSKRVMLQWIPAHCGMPGNEHADELEKQGAQKQKCEIRLTFHEKKTITKSMARHRIEKDLKCEEQAITF